MEKREREEDLDANDLAKRKKLSVEIQAQGPAADGRLAERIMPPGLELPSGWIECPPMGHRMNMLRLVPVKVPLGRRFAQVLTDEEHFSPAKLVEQLQSKKTEVGRIIDLTNTWRYYERDEIDELGVEHVKIRCRGRGQVPEAEAVNTFVWDLLSYHNREPSKWTVLHCTHGYNRTGYMVVSFMVRHGMSVEKALRIFAEHRPPGIYKEDYIRQLYKYNHEPLPTNFKPPHLPAWKPEEPDSPKADQILDSGAVPEEATSEPEEMKHDDIVGEVVPEEEAAEARNIILQLVYGPDPQRWPGGNLRFPGGQPVSLDRQNISLLHEKRYWVTWKADGTRYMMLLCRWGVYLIDRAFNVRRVQMRFPAALVGKDGMLKAHHLTLLDGEMLVDEDQVTEQRTRRFLAYDLIALNGTSLVHRPSKERWARMEEAVIRPRRKEREAIERDAHTGQHAYPARYDYRSEAFSVRRKEFWPLSCMSSLLDSFIPALSHEADGLIFQGYEDHYVPGTDQNLLKWKFAHMNSVDFRLRSKAAGPELLLLETRQVRAPVELPLPGARLAEGPDVKALENLIVECAWDGEAGEWRFMRTRSDKDTPNAYHVYEKVMQSIQDNITQDDLHAEIQAALQLSVYAKDVADAKRHAAAAAAGRK
ncbi:mRNA-capping enzyme [Coccomyxa sp. Obi]|nr:mRNA-capping enzyme [Coccomyxa sp. Obi]